jgi:nitroreductase
MEVSGMPSANFDLLAGAAKDALRAPSVLNTQPWTWHISGDALELHADRSRQLKALDPHGKLLLLSCGVALHHARLGLAARGRDAVVRHLVETFEGDLLASITVGPERASDPADQAMQRATWRRRTDRRPFGDQPVPTEMIGAMQGAAESAGAELYRVRVDQMSILAAAVDQAWTLELDDPLVRVEVMSWLNRPEWSSDGVPYQVLVGDMTGAPRASMPVEPADLGAAYLIVHGTGDSPRDWLLAGEAASAVMLTAASLELGIAPMSDVIEVAQTRELVASLLPPGRYPYLALRCGWPVSSQQPVTSTPRRPPHEAIVGLVECGQVGN